MLKRCGTIVGITLLAILLAATAGSTAERMAVSASSANIRSGPGTEGFEVLWQVEKYHPLQILQKHEGWYRFRDFEGDEGWIHEQLVDTTDTVITKNDIINVRSGPGTSHAIAFKAEKGVPFKVLERRGDWLQIQSADGDKGWVHRDLVW